MNALPRSRNQMSQTETMRLFECALVEDMSIEECSDCHEFVLRPLAAPEDAVTMCLPCILDYTARIVELGGGS